MCGGGGSGRGAGGQDSIFMKHHLIAIGPWQKGLLQLTMHENSMEEQLNAPRQRLEDSQKAVGLLLTQEERLSFETDKKKVLTKWKCLLKAIFYIYCWEKSL